MTFLPHVIYCMLVNRKTIFILVAVAFGAVAFHFRNVSSDGAVEVVIAHFNDLGGRIQANKKGRGGIIRLAGVWRRFQSKHPDAVLLGAGDMITGSALCTLTHGEGVFRLVDMMGMDAFAPGNHEFDHGVKQYLKFMEIAHFPFVAANLRPGKSLGKITLADAPYVILDAAGVKIGVIGLAHPATPFLTFRKNTRGVDFLKSAPSVRKLISEVDNKAQLVVALTHIGMNNDRKLARRVRGIDIIIGGHSPEATYRPVRVGKTWIAHAGDNGNFLGVVRVRLNPATEKVVKVKGNLLPVGSRTPPDPDMATAAAAEEEKLPIRPDEVIAEALGHYDKNEDLAPWIARLMKDYSGADVAMVNIGGVRADFEKGSITYRDVFRVMPFDNQVVVIRIHGKELARWIRKGNLITDRSFRPDRSRFYKVATMDFVVSKRRIPEGDLRTTQLKVRDLMIQNLKRRGTLRL